MSSKRSRQDPAQGSDRERISQAIQIADLVVRSFELWTNIRGDSYATEREGIERTFLVGGRAFRQWVQNAWYAAAGGKAVANRQTLQEVVAHLEARAAASGIIHDDPLRVGSVNDRHFLFLGDAGWRVVEFSADGWQIVNRPLTRFRKTPTMAELPEPARGGDLNELWAFLNVAVEDRIVLLTWMIQSLLARGPYPLLLLAGEQGSGKSTFARVLQRLIDPSSSDVRSAPKNVEDLYIAAIHSHLVIYDNMSRLPQWLSDGLCQIVTGGAYTSRQLYTDADEVILRACNPIIITAIPEIIHAPDLQERSIPIRMEHIGEGRRTEGTFWNDFKKAHASILGALLDLACRALRELPDVTEYDSHRMADFAKLGVAVDRALGGDGDGFLDRYGSMHAEMHRTFLEESPIFTVIQKIVADNDGTWTGTAQQLWDELSGRVAANDRLPGWPKGPRALGRQLQLLAPAMRETGMTFSKRKSTDGRLRLITIAVSQQSKLAFPPLLPKATDVNTFASDNDRTTTMPLGFGEFPTVSDMSDVSDIIFADVSETRDDMETF